MIQRDWGVLCMLLEGFSFSRVRVRGDSFTRVMEMSTHTMMNMMRGSRDVQLWQGEGGVQDCGAVSMLCSI